MTHKPICLPVGFYHYDHDFDKAIQYFKNVDLDDPSGGVSEDLKRSTRQHLMYALAADGSPEGIEEAITMADTGTDLPSLVAQCYAYKRAGKK